MSQVPPPREYTASIGTLPQAAASLQEALSLSRGEERRREVRFLDTFDWRVHRAGFRLAATGDVLELTALDTGAVVLRASGEASGRLAEELPAQLRAKLGAVLGLRALLPVATLALSDITLVARNADDKIVARLLISAVLRHAQSRPTRRGSLRIAVVPLRGYAKEGRRLSAQIADIPGVSPADTTLFEEAVAGSGRQVGDYTGKLAVDLDPRQPAEDAVGVIYRSLLATMQANEDGVSADLDTEFLHDFRVAVRRTRSALKELRDVLPAKAQGRFRREFKWLGDITTPTRDLDVYLLTFPDFQASASASAADLAPLHALLLREQRRTHAELARALRSKRYGRLIEEWERLIDVEAATEGWGPAAGTPIGVLADDRIRKVGRRVFRSGSAITADSPAEGLHDLRKRCKELRYLLEFFGGFYDPDTAEGLIGALKGLQDNLGEFQDSAVQHHAIDGFAEALLADGSAPAATLLALGRLGGALEERQERARVDFADRFAAFAEPANRERLAALSGAGS